MGDDDAAAGEMLLTILLKHRQSMNLAEINQKLEQIGFWKKSPPEGVEVVSWYVMMGIGQVVTSSCRPGACAEVDLHDRAERLGRLRDRVLPHIRFPPRVWQGIKAPGKPRARLAFRSWHRGASRAGPDRTCSGRELPGRSQASPPAPLPDLGEGEWRCPERSGFDHRGGDSSAVTCHAPAPV